MITDAAPAATTGDSAEAFGREAEPFRRELLLHCYRMLGSVDDAEDAVQEAFTRAWHGRSTFRPGTSFRPWLYRIATNVCLDAIERRRRGPSATQPIGVGPLPDELVAGVEPGPESRYDRRESISLAFTTALQLLPPRQRAVLILRDVLSWHATEVSDLLELSVPAVNSALHRARTTLAKNYDARRGVGADASIAPGALRSLLERYVRAWEAADVPGLVALLREDAVLAMPPTLAYVGPQAIAAFLAEAIFVDGRRIRLMPVRANGGPAYAAYARRGEAGPFDGFSVILLTAGEGGIARLDAYRDTRLLARFGMPDQLSG